MNSVNHGSTRTWGRGASAGWGRASFAPLVVVLLTTSLARAQSSSDKVAAETLFEDGRKLVSQGQYDTACKKLAESQRLDPGTGTLLNLADCYEKAGRTATAWATWREAAASARSSGQSDREQLAREHASALESKLVKLSIDVPDASRVPGLTVTRDDAPVSEALWGSAVPVDPGRVMVRASAPGYQTWTAEVQIAADKPETRVSVPALTQSGGATAPSAQVPGQQTPMQPVPGSEASPGAAVPGAGATDTGTPGSGRRVLGIVATAVGGVSVAVGSYFGLQAKSKYNDSKAYCPVDVNRCSAQGVTLRNDALSAGNTATVLFAIGGVALVGGIVLIATAPSSASPGAPPPHASRMTWHGMRADAGVLPGGGALTLEGEF